VTLSQSHDVMEGQEASHIERRHVQLASKNMSKPMALLFTATNVRLVASWTHFRHCRPADGISEHWRRSGSLACL